MRKHILTLVTSVLVVALVVPASLASVQGHYSHARKATQARCGDKNIVGRDIRQFGLFIHGKVKVARKSDYLRSIGTLESMCRPVPVVQHTTYVPHTTSYVPSHTSSGGGGGGGYCGAYQFDQQTWNSVGGQGSPCGASPAEQDKRAQMLQQSRGNQPWPRCGRGGASLAQIRQCENSGRY